MGRWCSYHVLSVDPGTVSLLCPLVRYPPPPVPIRSFIPSLPGGWSMKTPGTMDPTVWWRVMYENRWNNDFPATRISSPNLPLSVTAPFHPLQQSQFHHKSLSQGYKLRAIGRC
ncbi:hypothetical protein BRADI_3g29112v3 [Brachypodium distachyon]|uniref:Uncharacterized protein n=1 Tax=Brachypodium distachyon TaxID=15368 RepID=A0A0Q3JFR1_BRADI|nr:hypothetical protein BRADI_3g29112v3 [Brachypodium distachyon]